MGHPEREPDAIEERRVTVADLYLNGWSITRIARHLNVTRQTIYTDINAIRLLWAEQQTQSYQERVTRSLEKLDLLESKYAHRADTGDVAAGQLLLRIEERRAKLLALDQPVHVIIEDALSAEIRELAEQVGALDHPKVREILNGDKG